MATSCFKKVVLTVSVLALLMSITLTTSVEAKCGSKVTHDARFKNTVSYLLNLVVGLAPSSKNLSVTQKRGPVRVEASCNDPSSDPNDCAACLGGVVVSLDACLASGDVRESGSFSGDGCKVRYGRVK